MNIKEKMKITIDLAKEAIDNGELPIAAVIFLDDIIISKSYTSEKTDKRYLVHAELKALIEADVKRFSFKDRKKMQLFTTLEPCMMCMGASMSFFIGEVYYSLESPSDGAVAIAQEWNPKSKDFPAFSIPKIYGGILRQETQALFNEYVQKNENGAMCEWAKALANLDIDKM